MKKLRVKVPRLNLKKVIYPLLTLVYGIVVILLVVLSIRFLSTNINAAFKIEDADVEAQLLRVNVDGFLEVAKKFGIEVSE